jgi:toxin FitB
VERIRHRGDTAQAKRIERWLRQVTTTYAQAVLPFDEETAHVWGRLRVPNLKNPLDKQIAATALIHDLVVVTRIRIITRQPGYACAIRLCDLTQTRARDS